MQDCRGQQWKSTRNIRALLQLPWVYRRRIVQEEVIFDRPIFQVCHQHLEFHAIVLFGSSLRTSVAVLVAEATERKFTNISINLSVLEYIRYEKRLILIELLAIMFQFNCSNTRGHITTALGLVDGGHNTLPIISGYSIPVHVIYMTCRVCWGKFEELASNKL